MSVINYFETIRDSRLQKILKRGQSTSGSVDQHVIGLTDAESYDAEQYRKLRYVLEEKHKPEIGLVVGICSPASGDGKSLTALNLAVTLAEAAGVKVLLIDTDLRRNSVTLKSLLGLSSARVPGLADAIVASGTGLSDVATYNILPNMTLILSGNSTAKPYEILRSTHFGQLLNEARKQYDYIILDTPPVVPVPDCQVMARKIDVFLMVVRAHRTPRPMLEEALDIMDPDKLLGIIFNNSDPMPSRYYGYYRYGTPSAKKKHSMAAPRSTADVSRPATKQARNPHWTR